MKTITDKTTHDVHRVGGISSSVLQRLFGLDDASKAPPAMKIVLQNLNRDYLERSSVFSSNGGWGLQISPFPNCCGIRVVHSFSNWGVLGKQRLLLALAVDAYINYPGRYMFAVPGHMKNLKEGPTFKPKWEAFEIVQDVLKEVCNREPTYSYNPVMDTTIEVREFQFSKRKPLEVPEFAPFAKDVVALFKSDEEIYNG